jgi:glycerophosphoryl diester phosphodiesterase
VLIQRIQSTGKKVYAWTANDERAYHRLATRGVDGIVTNHPGRLAQYLEVGAADRRGHLTKK